jgi:hypothetical protein
MTFEGKGGKEIAKALNTDGLKLRTGKHFTTTAINYILRNEVYTGILIWNIRDRTFGRWIKKPEEEVIRVPDTHLL